MNKIAYNEIEVAVFISMAPEEKGLSCEGAGKGETAEGIKRPVCFASWFCSE
ncbi:MAG: hypothetical protein HFI90_04180 [Clostridia bacterium]|nr:hypothetical protein [Clostridia bacterium]